MDAVKDGLNASAAQSVTWKGTGSDTLAPSALERVPSSFNGLQLVGLNVKPGRLIVTLTCLISSGMPSSIVGIAYPSALRVRDRGQRRGDRVDLEPRTHHQTVTSRVGSWGCSRGRTGQLSRGSRSIARTAHRGRGP